MIYLSIDVEASGPCPGLHAMVSFGAAPVRKIDGRWAVDEAQTFYAELSATEGAVDIPEAMAIHGLTRAHLDAHGEAPADAMARFTAYLQELQRSGEPVKSAAWPSSFDHAYVTYYLQRYTAKNPLGHSGFDIASFAMGLFRVTRRRPLFAAMEAAGYAPPANPAPHHGLHDAIEQGQTLAWLLAWADAEDPPCRG